MDGFDLHALGLDERPSDADIDRWWDSQPRARREEFERAAANAPRFGPQVGPQTSAYFSPAQVTGYGGAAGGGKSALIALLAVNEHQRSVIFRHDGKQVENLVANIVEFAGAGEAGLNRGWGTFRLPGGKLIEWGGIGKPGASGIWRGRAHDLIAYDEVQELQEEVVRHLMAWNRSATQGQRCRILMCFNPPGNPEDPTGALGRWVIDYFAPWLDEYHPNPAQHGEIRYFWREGNEPEFEVDTNEKRPLKLANGETRWVRPQSRTFIGARVEDNEYIDDNYLVALAALEEPHRTRLMTGDFRGGISDDEGQVIPSMWLDAAMRRWTTEGRSEPQSSVGCDVSRGGKSDTVTAPRHGWWWDELERTNGDKTKRGSQVTALCIQRMRQAPACVDANGVGSSTVDFMEENGVPHIAVMSQQRKNLPRLGKNNKCLNMRSSLWWLLRMVLDPDNGLHPSLPNDKRLRMQLLAPKYERRGGLIQVEDKASVLSRTGKRLDDADAVVYSLANAQLDQGAERVFANVRRREPKEARPARTGRSWLSA